MKKKKIPVKIPLNHDGSFIDVLQDFINTMTSVTGGEVDIDCSLKGELTVFFEGGERPVNKNKSYDPYDLESLLYPIEYRSNEKLDNMVERKSRKIF